MQTALVNGIMSTPVLSITPGMLASEALALAYEHEVHHLPVVDNGRAVGMVCTCDLEDLSQQAAVSSSMRSPVSTRPQTSTGTALQLMNSNRVGSLLVIDSEQVVGIVTRRDLQQSGVLMYEDPRGYCSCCGSIAHLRKHVTGALCADCFARSNRHAPLEHGGGD